MTILAAALILTLAALVTVNLAWLRLLDRRDQRERDERQSLLQRIQAPEIAVAQHVARTAPPDDPMPPSDDEHADPEQLDALARLERLANSEAPWLS